ncbi:MAG: molecular chaperone TorD family protein, partial [Nitrospirae bacterium]|nr:molecular chaperone TorD family protein [Nitrospirota bacterium]
MPVEGDGRSPVIGGKLNTTAIHNPVIRAEIYRILSECYKEPCIEFAQDLAEGRFYQELEGNLKRLGINIPLDGLKISNITASRVERREGEGFDAELSRSAPSGFAGGGGRSLPFNRDKAANHLQSLKEIFYPLFVGPSPSIVLPVESVYKVWDREGSGLVPSEARGMLMGDPAIDMLKRYRDAGMEIPAIYKDMPDHLALLLEYMAFLCESGAGEEGEGSQETSASSVEPSEVRFLVEHLDWLQELNRLVYSFTEE